MSWIKDNQFMVALCGGTLVGVALLYYVGSGEATNYESAKAQFDEAAAQASGFESQPLYPTIQNRDGKLKAIDEYRKSVESIQTAFEKFRPKDIKDVSPQDFTNQLKETNSEIRKAFEEAGTTVPEAFFAGFEGYIVSLARPNATGMLNYQLKAIKNIMLDLAKAKPSEFRNLYRPNLPEEDGQTYTPQANDVVRSLPLEITFVGPEKSAREFLSALVKPGNQYVVIRALRITNAKKDPPKAADAKFDKPAAAKPAAAEGGFGGFVLPGDDASAASGNLGKSADVAISPAVADSGRILAQVLGNEQVQVFVRLDILQFLPAKKLP